MLITESSSSQRVISASLSNRMSIFLLLPPPPPKMPRGEFRVPKRAEGREREETSHLYEMAFGLRYHADAQPSGEAERGRSVRLPLACAVH